MTKTAANKIFDILVEHAGAQEDIRENFVYHALNNDNPLGFLEYRFGGLLGFGGKIWIDKYEIKIDCYSEDWTPKRQRVIKKVNKMLREIRIED